MLEARWDVQEPGVGPQQSCSQKRLGPYPYATYSTPAASRASAVGLGGLPPKQGWAWPGRAWRAQKCSGLHGCPSNTVYNRSKRGDQICDKVTQFLAKEDPIISSGRDARSSLQIL